LFELRVELNRSSEKKALIFSLLRYGFLIIFPPYTPSNSDSFVIVFFGLIARYLGLVDVETFNM